MEELEVVPKNMIGQDEGNAKGNIGNNHEGFARNSNEDIFSEG
jgi:hypothetical protein